MNLLIYLLKMLLISALLCTYYMVFLRNRSFHRFNRLFLLSIPVMALVLPLLQLGLPYFSSQDAHPMIQLLRVGEGKWEDAVTITPGHSSLFSQLSVQNLLILVYALGAVALAWVFVRSLRYIWRISSHYPFYTIEEVRFYPTDEPAAPFSFFNRIFWSRPIDPASVAGQQVLKHELYHVKQHHSSDVFYLELLGIFFWFNPFFHWLKKETRAIHEFLADQYATSGSDRHDYAEMLLLQTLHARQIPLTHPFFHHQIKRRITMITKIQQFRNPFLGRIMILPLVILLACAFTRSLPSSSVATAAGMTVIIDAGHGGSDAGVYGSAGSIEKDISLSIAKKISQLAAGYQIKVILSRDKDELAGAGSSISESLDYRLGLVAKNKAQLFISIHANGNPADQSAKGFEIFVPDDNSKQFEKSRLLGSILASSIKKDYSTAAELKQQSDRIRVLSRAIVPSALIECGYLTNAGDEAYIRDEKNQEKIARDILESIQAFAQQSSSAMLGQTSERSPDPVIFGHLLEDENDAADVLSQDQTVYSKVEVEAEYPGGKPAWSKFLNTTLRYPDAAVDKEVQGDVLVQFIVDTDGTLSDIKVLSGPELLRAESVRVFQQSGKWIPAKNGGVAVKSYRKQPIKYRLEQQQPTKK